MTNIIDKLDLEEFDNIVSDDEISESDTDVEYSTTSRSALATNSKQDYVVNTFPEFLEKFATWNPEKAVRIKDPKTLAYILDKIFWENPLHHYSEEFRFRLMNFINKTIRRYGMEEQYYDEDLPVQVYNRICEAINSYYDPTKANVITFLHQVLFNHIKLKGYHIRKYKDGTFYNKYYTYDSIIKSIVKSMKPIDLITLDNYFDHLEHVSINSHTRQYLKDDLIKIAPKNNILFKAVVWEVLQDVDMKVGKLHDKFTNRQDRESIELRRSKIRRS